MANPNIVNVTSITGQTALANLTTGTANIVTNAAASNTVVKLNMVTLANFTTSNVACNVMINRSSATFFQIGNVSVPAQSTMVVVGKDTVTYMLEGDVLQANAASNTAVSITASYEIIN
jgi:hypothetical protein